MKGAAVDIAIPEGALIGSADDPTSPQPADGDRVLILERPQFAHERLRAGQFGVARPRPLLNWRGRPVIAQGCPWVETDLPTKFTEGRLLASRWAILPAAK
jgi:hypothetical protein